MCTDLFSGRAVRGRGKTAGPEWVWSGWGGQKLAAGRFRRADTVVVPWGLPPRSGGKPHDPRCPLLRGFNAAGAPHRRFHAHVIGVSLQGAGLYGSLLPM